MVRISSVVSWEHVSFLREQTQLQQSNQEIGIFDKVEEPPQTEDEPSSPLSNNKSLSTISH